jgi:hypothetical protein
LSRTLEDADAYAPEVIRYWLGGGRCERGQCHWAMLESATQGGTGAFGLGAGGGDRMGLAIVKADLERGADALPLHWQTTALVYSRQHRASVYSRRRRVEPPVPDGQREEECPIPSEAYELVLERMARYLGWVPESERKAA